MHMRFGYEISINIINLIQRARSKQIPLHPTGYVEVSGVKEIDGLASVWPNQGPHRLCPVVRKHFLHINHIKDL